MILIPVVLYYMCYLIRLLLDKSRERKYVAIAIVGLCINFMLEIFFFKYIVQ